MKNIIDKANELCNSLEYPGTLVYLTKFGSHLYGTNSKDSDLDYKGIFIPSIKSLIHQHKCKSLQFHTGDNTSKNSKDDIDIQLWSVHYWLDLLRLGDTNSIDLLYSITSDDCVIKYDSNELAHIFNHPEKYIDLKNNRSYISYAYSQAKKYGIKGSRLGIIKDIYRYLIENYQYDSLILSDVLDTIIEKFHHETYCFIDYSEMKPIIDVKSKWYPNGIKMLNICGSLFQETIKLTEVIDRLKNTYKKYGERAQQAELNCGIDHKAISHAVRCLNQTIELLENRGRLLFPLESAGFLKEIKSGKLKWKEIESIVMEKFEIIDKLLLNYPENKELDKYHTKLIDNLYSSNFRWMV